MDELQKVAEMWKMGFGDMGQKMGGKDRSQERQQVRALKSDWKTLPMPPEHARIELGIPLSSDEFEVLALGHVPHVMEDHWFMYFDGEAFCFHRSWTGICIYRVVVSHAEDDYVLAHVLANRDRSQYGETSDEKDCYLALMLVGEALGKDMSELWEGYFAAGRDEASPSDKPFPVVGFWKPDEEFGCLSNWHDTGFDFLDTRYATAEHWIMWQKARVMGDDASANKIMHAPAPAHVKNLGKGVTPYDDLLWSDVRERLAYVGIREKFLQNPEIARVLLSTGPAILAEASPYDKLWGIGITRDAKGFSDFTGWNGENLLGRILMRVRADLRLAYLMGLPERELGTTREDVEDILQSEVRELSLLALARNPLTRASALCYARIASHAASHTFPTVRILLATAGQSKIVDIDQAMNAGQGSLTTAGWHELLVELAFLRRVGKL